MKTCAGTNRLGKHCGFRTAAAATYCNTHQPGADVSALRSHAGQASAAARHFPSHYLIEAPITVHDRASIQAVLDSVVRLTLSGHLTIDRARIILRACAIASRNFNATRDTLAGPIPPAYDGSNTSSKSNPSCSPPTRPSWTSDSSKRPMPGRTRAEP